MTDASSAAPLVLLGPQRLRPTVDTALADLGVAGPVAVVTAGWQERESEIEELCEHLGCEVVDLELFRRAEELFERDVALFTALRARTQQLRRLQRLYSARLDHAMAAAREILARRVQDDLVAMHFEGAVRAIRELDREHLARVEELRAAFDEEHGVAARDDVVAARQDVARLVDGCGALAIAGGHVAVLVNRLRLFDAVGAAGDRPIVAWSAGAMALADRIVLFHDSPPQGAGNAEVLRAGLGLYGGVLPLPHAKRRLRLGDPARVALFARRFAPSECLAFDDGARIDRTADGWTVVDGVTRLMTDGRVVAGGGR